MAAEPPIRAILIAGPTASGKSALALALAERFGGVVVNADASQVYADLRLLSARPSEADEARTPHALYGHVDAAEAYAVGRYLDDVHRVINSLATGLEPGFQQTDGTGLLPIFVGGTGLYLEALTAGLAAVPAIPHEIRAHWRSFGSAPELHAELARRDPEMAARLRPTDPQRLIRALEVLDATGRSLASWQEEATRGPLDPADTLCIALAPDRAILRDRIAARLEIMVAEGAIEEAAKLDARGLDPSLPAMKALGVRPFAAHARGEISLDEALERTRLDTGRYAKRQSTWFRNRMPGWLQAAPNEALELTTNEIERRGTK